MNLEEVKHFLNDNKENADVKAYLEELSAVSADKVKGFLETDEGQKLIRPKLDQHFTKSLETWKANNLDELVNAKVKELYPEETEEQKRIRKLEQELEKQQKEAKREKLMNTAISYASEKGLPTDIVAYFLGDDEETTKSNLSTLEEKYHAAVQQAVENKFKENGRTVEPGGGGSGQGGNLDIGSLAAEASIRK
ncbi:DUF4355 domain-containing protein [Bacillus glycinifermentans]|uniref:DUF4355 domain-containing protein n=1 Tax=Bacillus glycinifermentans TaxID=1664069 RepID=A0A0T6BQV8_9BACI|nr:DUF4355 domain-containing protein [Bacillus glycinifermentans]KRT94015.1 hypothetical protein AB447_215320 [Bacillus glycinifermentans]MEC0487400.1 DUF4355 domain-containing protein [Bacillus glycinifermentans]